VTYMPTCMDVLGSGSSILPTLCGTHLPAQHLECPCFGPTAWPPSSSPQRSQTPSCGPDWIVVIYIGNTVCRAACNTPSTSPMHKSDGKSQNLQCRRYGEIATPTLMHTVHISCVLLMSNVHLHSDSLSDPIPSLRGLR